MSWTDYDIVGSYNNQRVTSIDAERSINLFEYLDTKGKKKKSLLPTSGIFNTGIDFGSVGGGFRAQYVFQGFTYAVIGNSVVRISGTPGNYTFTPLNGSDPLTTTVGYVGIDANTYQIILVDGMKGYIWDTISLKFVTITDPAFPLQPIDVCYLDGFFIVASGGTNNFLLSEFNQGLIWGVDNTGSESTFSMAAGSANIVISYATGGSIANYQVGTTIVFSGGSLPAELVAGVVYYVVAIVNSTTIQVSATDGGAPIVSAAGGSGSLTNEGQLQQASITSHPGNIVACRTLHRRLFLFSQFFTEVWENAGAAGNLTNLPFRRNNSFLIEYGTPAIGSIQVGFDMMFFLSQDRDGLGSVQKVVGTQAMPVSTRALDFQLAQYAAMALPPGTPNGTTGVTDARGILIKENGLIFYRLNFTLANHTFVYNDTMSNPMIEEERRWHEEETLAGNRHVAQTHTFYNGVNYYGSYFEAIMYQVDPNFSTNDGEPIRRARIGRPYTPETYQRLRIDRFHLDLVQGSVEEVDTGALEIDLLAENGNILTTENNVNLLLENSEGIMYNAQPIVFLSISRDGSQSYGAQLKAPMGKIGNRTFRTVWRKLGTIPRGQSFTPYIQFFNEIPFIILGAAWVFEVMPE